jgi:hypothetical protein
MTRCGSLFRLALEMKAVRSEEIAYPSTRYIRWSTLIWPRTYINPGSNSAGAQGSCPEAARQSQWLLIRVLGNLAKVPSLQNIRLP